MALLAKLQLGNNDIKRYNKEYLVCNVRCHFCRTHNNKQPNSSARCESITFTIVAPDSRDRLIYDWYVNMSCLSGRMLFMSPDSASDDVFTKEIYFEDARCLSFNEHYDIRSNNRRQLTVSFEAECITANDIQFKHL